MLDHLDLLDEPLAAVVAFEGTLARVNADVVLQVRHDVGGVVAKLALELLGREAVVCCTTVPEATRGHHEVAVSRRAREAERCGGGEATGF